MFGDRITIEELEEIVLAMQEDVEALTKAVLELQNEQNKTPNK